jgi:hypothetical protein
LSIGIGLAWDNNGKVTKHRKLVIDSVETDRGEKLTPDLAAAAEERAVHSMVIGLNGHDANARETEIIVPLSAPTIRTQKIRRLTGSVEVDYFVGPKKQVVLGPVKNCLGKPVAVEGRPGVNIIVSRIDGGLDIQMPSAFMDSIEQITMTNAQGAELEAFNGSSNSQDGIIVAHCAVKMPDDGQVIVEYYTRSGSVRVPLNITDIRLPAILNIGADDRVASATALYRSFGLSCSD